MENNEVRSKIPYSTLTQCGEKVVKVYNKNSNIEDNSSAVKPSDYFGVHGLSPRKLTMNLYDSSKVRTQLLKLLKYINCRGGDYIQR
jgi:hypothetical protein